MNVFFDVFFYLMHALWNASPPTGVEGALSIYLCFFWYDTRGTMEHIVDNRNRARAAGYLLRALLRTPAGRSHRGRVPSARAIHFHANVQL